MLITLGNGVIHYALSYSMKAGTGLDAVAKTNATKFVSVSISNSSSGSTTNKSGQPALVANVSVAHLNRANIAVNLLHPKVIPSPVSENKLTGNVTTKASNKTIVTIANFTNSSSLSPERGHYAGQQCSGCDPPKIKPSLTPSITRQYGIIDGLTYFDSGGYDPADAQLAIGPNHIVELVNLAGKVWLKTALPSYSFSLNQFFETGSHFISDPRIIYDNSSGRWFASILDRDTTSVKLSVSATDDPTGTWLVYNFPFSDCPDEPMIAVSNDKLAISANDVSGKCNIDRIGAQYTFVDKNDLLTGFDKPRFLRSEVNASQWSILPVKMPDSSFSSSLFLATVGGGGSNIVTLFNVTGKVPSPLSIGHLDLPVHMIMDPQPTINAAQPFVRNTIYVGDARLLDGAIFKGKMWLTYTDSCKPIDDLSNRTCIGLIQIDMTKNKVSQNFDFAKAGYYFYYPALGIGHTGDLNIVFGVSSPKMYPSVYVTGQKVGSAPGSLDNSTDFTLGGGNIISSALLAPFGDYFSLAQDPSNPNSFWVVGEYTPVQMYGATGPGQGWSTIIGNFTTIASPNGIPNK